MFSRFLVEPYVVRRLLNQPLSRELRSRIVDILDKIVLTLEISKTIDNKIKICALCHCNEYCKT